MYMHPKSNKFPQLLVYETNVTYCKEKVVNWDWVLNIMSEIKWKKSSAFSPHSRFSWNNMLSFISVEDFTKYMCRVTYYNFSHVLHLNQINFPYQCMWRNESLELSAFYLLEASIYYMKDHLFLKECNPSLKYRVQ